MLSPLFQPRLVRMAGALFVSIGSGLLFAATPGQVRRDGPAWRTAVTEISLLVENDVPAALAKAQELRRTFPADAGSVADGQLLNLASIPLAQLGRTAEATASATQARDIARIHTDVTLETEAEFSLLTIGVTTEKFDEALRAAERCIPLLEKTGNLRLHSIALSRVALVHLRRAETETALKFATQARDLAEKAHDEYGLALAHRSLGFLFIQSKRLGEAAIQYTESIAHARASGSKSLVADTLENLAIASGLQGRRREAEAGFREALALRRETGNRLDLPRTLNNLALNLHNQQRDAEALILIAEAVVLFRGNDSKLLLTHALNTQSMLRGALGDFTGGLADAEEAYTLALELGIALTKATAAKHVAAAAAMAGDHRRAYEMALITAEHMAQAARESADKHVASLEQLYASERKQRQIDDLNLRNQVQTAELAERTLRQKMLAALLAACLCIVGATGYFFLRLRRNHAELARANAQLTEQRANLQGVTAELQASQAFLGSMLENLPVNIYRKDTEGRLTFANQHYCARLGLPLAEVTGKPSSDFSSPESREKDRADDRVVMETRQPSEKIEIQIKSTGEKRWIHIIKVAVTDHEGRVVGTQGMFWDVTKAKEAELELERVHRKLLDVSRQAGMAEVATNVLHNVGNVLNSVNVSATLLTEWARHSKSTNVAKLSAMLREHETDLGAFMTGDSRGRQVPGYLQKLAEHLEAEQRDTIRELDSLRKNIEHINDIVAKQQSYAKVAGVTETLPVVELVEDVLQRNADALERAGVTLVRDFVTRAVITVDRHKASEILTTLLGNAKDACSDSGRTDKSATVHLAEGEGRIKISVTDNGVGIPADNLTRIFEHGFSMRKGDDGFALHRAALAARELGGSLRVSSDGAGEGATFVLELPHQAYG
jgi:PAS domain S-box-containing protein